ncbi:MAG: hypothetical protein HYZ00_02120, partial [Candidatus Hydrogenedentes bacterium]|nr:hypothetical protein [Candidatus Hydrogenedentota bacterium]
SAEAIDQYQWPPGRVALFVPAAAVLFGVTLYRMRRILVILRDSSAPWEESTYHTEWMIDLLAFIGLVGAVSIWPDKSIVLYALFLCLALFAFGRINRRLDSADRRT